MRVSRIQLSMGGAICALASVVLATLAGSLWAQTPSVLRIEEDWELVIGTPEPSNNAPQVTTLFSPVGSVESVYSTFTLNHHDVPNFTPGGLQIQLWDGKKNLASKGHPNQELLATLGETIRWTQVMRLSDEGLIVEIINGTSTTWGNFGGDDSLKLVVPTQLLDLGQYDPQVSVKHSSGSFAANRVQSLVLKSVRAYNATGLAGEDNTPRIVHSLNQ